LGIGKNKATEENNQGKSKVWIVWAFLAFILCGSNQITNSIPSYDMNIQSNFNYAARALCSATATAVLAFIWNLIANCKQCLKQLAHECRNPWLWFFVVAMQSLSLCCIYLLQYRCLDILANYNTASIAYPLLVSTCLCGFTLYSLIVLKEKLTRLQFLGLALSLIGIIFICIKR
jgi:drug/metabolite transporter (DMT)-like permease